MAIKAFAPFGYEGAIITVETDIREGNIPATDIVGIADASVSSLRKRVQESIEHEGYSYPKGRVLVSLSPADIRKDGAGYDLAVALSILSKDDRVMLRSQDADIIVVGELYNGNVLSVPGVYAALDSAKKAGIKYAIIPVDTEKVPDGIIVQRVATLDQAFHAMNNAGELEDCPSDMVNPPEAHSNGFISSADSKTTFAPLPQTFGNVDCNNNGLVYATVIAVAGGHSMLVTGAPGCGKSALLAGLPQILPDLRIDEQLSTNRIYSLAGLNKPEQKIIRRPFRMPHQTASIEGIYGGGPNCRPGEVSLAHNGVLFLDEAAEFRSSILQMLRTVLDSKSITLSRAGRSTTYPAKFQLFMTANPCPCGNYGAKDRICLCSAKSIEMYWKKFSKPLLDRIAIKYDCNNPIGNFSPIGAKEARAHIMRITEAQYKRYGKLAADLTSEELKTKLMIDGSGEKTLADYTAKHELTQRQKEDIIRVARTVLDFWSTEYCVIGSASMSMAIKLCCGFPEGTMV